MPFFMHAMTLVVCFVFVFVVFVVVVVVCFLKQYDFHMFDARSDVKQTKATKTHTRFYNVFIHAVPFFY